MSSERICLHDKENCSGCKACENICPKHAITMKENEEGFYYPEINESICVNCGLCKKVCLYQNNIIFNKVKEVYAATSKNDELLKDVASGGIFSSLALEILEKGGVVFGATMDLVEGKLKPHHIAVERIEELNKLKGSKYVQSDVENTYIQVKRNLESGRLVLFSGTPCQIEGLKLFLQKDFENLLTVDIICHGVPSAKMFQEYIECMEEKLDGKIYEYKFRDKSRGQGYAIKVKYKMKNGLDKVKVLDGNNDSYNMLFLKSAISRESCYSCKFAKKDRISDITIGDFWGIYEEHDNKLLNTVMSEDKGISCILVNTDKGEKYMKSIKNQLYHFESEEEKVMKHNGQLNKPVCRNPEREKIMQIYIQDGYRGLDSYVSKKLGMVRKIKNRIKFLLPKSFKRKIKCFLN